MTQQIRVAYPGVKDTVEIPAHRLERYKARGWSPVDEAQATSEADDQASDADVEPTPETPADKPSTAKKSARKRATTLKEK